MSIQNELSSEIAVALLTRQPTDPKKLNDLKDTVLRIHSMLQKETRESESKRAQRLISKRSSLPPSAGMSRQSR